jgi:hypothetical protein
LSSFGGGSSAEQPAQLDMSPVHAFHLILQDAVPPELVGFPDDVSTTCSPEGGGPAALPPVANVTAADPNDASFHPNTTFSEQQVRQIDNYCQARLTAATSRQCK